MKIRALSAVVFAAALASADAAAQFTLPKLPFGLGQPDAAPARPDRQQRAAEAAAAEAGAKALPMKPSAQAMQELVPDPTCARPTENFNVWDKALVYGGTNAQLRLERLIATDFQRDDLTEEDRKLLKYLAYTTVWVPVEVETKIGGLFAALGASPPDQGAGGRSERKAMDRLRERMVSIKSTVQDFPSDVRLLYRPSLADGAFAQVGGLVVISPKFLGLMDDNEAARDVVLAHELSHLYKRHTIKELQFQLINSNAGFSLAKKLMGRLNPAANRILPDMVFYARTAVELFEAVRESNAGFSKDQEFEADACSIEWLRRLGTDPAVAWRSFGTILGDSSAPADGSYSAAHPSPPERSANLDKVLGRGAKPQPVTAPPKTPKRKTPA